MKVMLFGATDLSVAVADAITGCEGIDLAGVVGGEESFSISYSAGGVRNARYADLVSWAVGFGVPAHRFCDHDGVAGFVAAHPAEVGLVAGWYHLLPGPVIDSFRTACLGLHASLLPRLRGHAPLNWAILSGLEETGVSLFEIGPGVDEGPIFGSRSFPVGPRTTIGQLVQASHTASVELIAECLPALAAGDLEPRPQEGEVTYGLHRTPDDGRVDWTRSAEAVDRLVRATGRPYPGAFSTLGSGLVRIWESDVPSAPTVLGAPGQVVRLPGISGPCVVCGQGVLEIVEATDDLGSDVLPALLRSGHHRFASGVSG